MHHDCGCYFSIMLINEQIKDYILSLEPELAEDLRPIEEYAKNNAVPIIRKETRALLRFLLVQNKPKKILEIGTAIGFSASYMAKFISDDATIDTIEKVKMRLIEARKNLKPLIEENKIRLIEEDAITALEKLEGKYDFIFLDAAKGQYPNYLPELIRLLDEKGILVTDNVLQDGMVYKSRYEVERRDRTIHSRMRDYLYLLTHDERLETVILPVGDGVAITVFK